MHFSLILAFTHTHTPCLGFVVSHAGNIVRKQYQVDFYWSQKKISRVRLGYYLDGRLSGNSRATAETGTLKKHPERRQKQLTSVLQPGKGDGYALAVNRSQSQSQGKFALSLLLSPSSLFWQLIKSLSIWPTKFYKKTQKPRYLINTYISPQMAC